MKKSWPVTAVLMGVLLLAGCAATTSTSPPPTSSSETTTITPSENSTTTVTVVPPETVEVVSLVGPLEPVNPGGPTVEMTMKNVADGSCVALTAILGAQSIPPGQLYTFNFDVSSNKTLAPGATISRRMTLVGGSLSYGISYPINIHGKIPNVGEFYHIETVRFLPPPGIPVPTSTYTPPVTTTPGQPPVQVVNVENVSPYLPAGPTLEIELKNVSSQPIVALAVNIHREFGSDYVFNFGVTPEYPLPPGEDAITMMTLVGPGANTNQMIISGTFADGSKFGFVAPMSSG
jgi:hypothetical protein